MENILEKILERKKEKIKKQKNEYSENILLQNTFPNNFTKNLYLKPFICINSLKKSINIVKYLI